MEEVAGGGGAHDGKRREAHYRSIFVGHEWEVH
jgi:hypothetical protein